MARRGDRLAEQGGQPRENPGEMLRRFLDEEVLPPQDKGAADFLGLADALLGQDGYYADLVRRQVLNSIVRLLVNRAQFYLRTAQEEERLDPWDRVREQLRAFLRSAARLGHDQREDLVPFVEESVKVSQKKPTRHTKKAVFRRAASSGEQYCFICGKPMDDDFEAEHVWPRSLGGLSTPHNLRPACSDCNGAKKDMIDGADFHFARVSFPGTRMDQVSIEKWEQIAVLALEEYSCTKCRKPSSRLGPLHIGRQDVSEPWSILNLGMYCPRHRTDN